MIAATVPIDTPPAALPAASLPAAEPSAGAFSSLGALSLGFGFSPFSAAKANCGVKSKNPAAIIEIILFFIVNLPLVPN
jgi:hypothetical protein